jgi:hypothetical protein
LDFLEQALISADVYKQLWQWQGHYHTGNLWCKLLSVTLRISAASLIDEQLYMIEHESAQNLFLA